MHYRHGRKEQRAACRFGGGGGGTRGCDMMRLSTGQRGEGGWHEAMALVCLPLAAPIGLSPLLILTLCGSERVLGMSTEPSDDLSCFTTPEVWLSPCR